jgi:hypothetical protein
MRDLADLVVDYAYTAEQLGPLSIAIMDSNYERYLRYGLQLARCTRQPYLDRARLPDFHLNSVSNDLDRDWPEDACS